MSPRGPWLSADMSLALGFSGTPRLLQDGSGVPEPGCISKSPGSLLKTFQTLVE